MCMCLKCVRATLPPSTLFADRALLHRGYSISEPNTWGETVSKPLGLTLGLVYNLSRLQLTRWSLHSIAKREWHRWICRPWWVLQAIKRWVRCRSAVWLGRGLSLDAIFARIFVHFWLNFTFLTPPFLLHVYLCHNYPSYVFHAHKQKTRTQFDTGHQTTHLLGYRHSKTVLLWSLLTQILCWNLSCPYWMLPPLKVLDFPDTEYK